MFRFFNSHTYLLSSVAFRLSKELNDVLWFASLVLNEFSVRPTYVWGGLLVVLSLVVTVAWYTTDSVIHLLDSGHSSLLFLGQLHTSGLFVVKTVDSVDLLCPSIVCSMLAYSCSWSWLYYGWIFCLMGDLREIPRQLSSRKSGQL